MLLANPFTHDTRVEKEARSLAAWGCEVCVIAIARTGLPLTEARDGVKVIRVPVRNRYMLMLALALLAWPFRPLLMRAVRTGEQRAGEGPSGIYKAVLAIAGGMRRAARAARRGVGSAWRSVTRAWSTGLDFVGRQRVIGPLVQIVRHVCRRARSVFRAYARLLRRRVVRQSRLLVHRTRRAVSRTLVRYLPVPVRLLGLNWEMARRARALHPDVVHAHDLNTLLGGMFVKRIDGTKLVYDSHELFLERNIGSNSRRVDRMVWSPVEKIGIKRADAVFSVSEGICRVLEERYGLEKVHLLRNVQPYEPPPERRRLLHEQLGLDADTRIAIYPGGITFNRGLELMIDSAPYLDRAVYVIMGYALDDEYRESLLQRARDRAVLDERVFFCEAVPMSEVVHTIASADIGMVPTRNACLSYYYEASNKMFHCLMAGVPLAMSDHPEKRLLVERYGVGVLFDETGDPREVAQAVNTVLNDVDGHADLRQRCLEAARVLNWEHEEHRLRTVYASLLGEKALPVPDPVIPAPETVPASVTASQP